MDRDTRKIEAGRRLRKARIAAGYKDRASAIDALAERFGDLYSYSSFGNYENGLRSFGPGEADDFAEVFHCSAGWLLCLKDASPVKPDEKALLDNYRHADERGKRVILNIAETQQPYSANRPDEKTG